MKIVFKAANESAAQDDNYDGRIRANFFLVFKDSFDQIRADQIMNILSVKTATHFDQFDGKAASQIFAE